MLNNEEFFKEKLETLEVKVECTKSAYNRAKYELKQFQKLLEELNQQKISFKDAK